MNRVTAHASGLFHMETRSRVSDAVLRRLRGCASVVVFAAGVVLRAFARERHSYSSVTIPAGMAQMPSVPRRPIASDRGNVAAEANAAMPVMYAEYIPVASDV